MKRSNPTMPSSFGREITLRIRKREFDILAEHMRQDCHNEQMAFGLGVHRRTAAGTVFLLNELILPDESDLSEQSACGVSPAHDFQSYVYFRAHQTGQDIVDIHTHPGTGTPHFSSIDEHNALANAKCITERLPDPITLLMLVGNNQFDAFDAVVWDRQLGQFRAVERFEVLGRPSEIHLIGQSRVDLASMTDATFDRQTRIPGWNQIGLARQRIGIAGMGGNGAPVFQSLIGMGAGREGSVTIVDHDLVEASNRPRIPFAMPHHDGVPKVTVTAEWAGRKSPSTPVYPYPCSITEKAVRDRLKTCTVLFGCLDNDGARMILDDLAVRYGIPLIDLGCDIQVDGHMTIAGGQVRVVLPGQNACLVCCNGFDPSEAAADLMDDAQQAARAARGYVRGAAAEATPSVANLNAVTAQFGIAQFLGLVCGTQFADWDYAHFDQFTLQTMSATTKQRDDCPCCGTDGFLGKGDSEEERVVSSQTALSRLEAE